MMCFRAGLVAVALLVYGGPAQAALSLDEYLSEVTRDNKGARAAVVTSSAAGVLSKQATLLVSPLLYGDVHFVDDKRPTTNPAFLGYETKVSSYTLGVSQLTTFGLEGKLSYSLVSTSLLGVNALFVPQASFIDAYPMLELKQSLWKNAFGAATQAEQNQREAQQLAVKYNEMFRYKLMIADAEMAYTRLVLARETVAVSRESLERAVKLREWSQRRARLELADKADLYQAQAALEVRRLELQSALDEERSAARAFNSARQRDSEVVEELVPLNADSIAALKAPAKGEAREDVLAAAQLERVTEATAELALQTLSPDVQIYGSMAYNGHRVQAGEAFSDSLSSRFPTWMAGVRFSAPIGLPTIFRSRAGQQDMKVGSALSLERKVFEQENEWKELLRGFTESQRRFELSRSIEGAQRVKLLHEKDRFAKGRTTAFQVLTFEQDFAAAQLNRIRVEGDVMKALAQLKTFSGGEAK